MKKPRVLLLAMLFVAALLGCGQEERPRLTALFINDVGYDKQDIRELTKSFQKEVKTYDVLPFFGPYAAQRECVLAPVAAEAQAYDVVLLDGIWTAEFVQAKFLVDLTPRVTDATEWVDFARESFTIDGKIYAVPWVVDCECLFYNKQMLQSAGLSAPPRTWAELEAQAKVIKDKGIVTYPIVAQWGHDEGLVCDFTTMLLGRGGSLLSPERMPAFASPQGIEVVSLMKKWLDDGLVNPVSLESRSDDARHVLSQGQAAFCVNWLAMYEYVHDAELSKVAGQIGVTLVPGTNGARGASIGRALGLAILATSPMPDEAWAYIRFLTKQETQKQYCKIGLPSYRSLYEDPVMVNARPGVFRLAKEQYPHVCNRPAVPFYHKMSTALQDELGLALAGKKKLDAALAAAALRTREAAKERPVYTR